MARANETSYCGALNPWNQRATLRNKVIAIVVVALGALAVVAGTFSLLATFGVGTGPFHTFTFLPIEGAIALALFGGMLIPLGLAWLISKRREPSAHVGAQVSPPAISENNIEPSINETEAFRYPERMHSTTHYLRPIPGGYLGYAAGANPYTLVEMDHVYYPANYVLNFKGRTPYMLSCTPPNSGKIELFDRMCQQENVGIIIKMVPNSPEPRDEAESLDIVPQVTSREDGIIEISYSQPFMTNIQSALNTIATLKSTIEEHELTYNNEHPMLVLSSDGKESGAFIMLYELASRFENVGDAERFIGAAFWDNVINLAIQIEYDSISGAAVEWANTILTQFNINRPYFPDLTDSNPAYSFSSSEFRHPLRTHLLPIFNSYADLRGCRRV